MIHCVHRGGDRSGVFLLVVGWAWAPIEPFLPTDRGGKERADDRRLMVERIGIISPVDAEAGYDAMPEQFALAE